MIDVDSQVLFYFLINALCLTICLGMIGCTKILLYSHHSSNFFHQSQHKLWSTFWDDDAWESMFGYKWSRTSLAVVISCFTAKSFFCLLSATLPILLIISITSFLNILQFQILPHLFRIIPIPLISFNFASLIFYLPYASHLWCSTFPYAPQFPLGNLVLKALSHFILLLPLLLALV